jgi:ribosomal protein S18 acetylase RimI-like enzyme
MRVEIREITEEQDLNNSLNVIRTSFQTVARELNLTRQNCPNHPTFMTLEKLNDFRKKAKLFGLFNHGEQIGFVAMEKADEQLYYLDRLSVLPGHRHHGYGKKLVEFIITRVIKAGGSNISLGMIDSHTVLKEWYKSLGFIETETRKFEHLPFTVCFMERDLSGK